MGEEYEIEEDNPIAVHFGKPIVEIELGKKLSRYHELCVEIASLEGLKDALREEIIHAGRGMESINAGGYVAFFKKVSGRVSTNWEAYARSQIKDITADELRPYIKRGEDSVRVEVKRL